ncbi:hypothetical protein FACS1894159_09800 [Bacteroidia bacterium]|nr:hypothetical protein FACS1894159_09800 [Bacteroidia bacterium]
MRFKGLLYLILLLVVTPLLAWRLALGSTWHTWRQAQREARQLERLGSVATDSERADDRGSNDGMALDTTEYIQSGLVIERLLPEASRYGVSVVSYTPFMMAQEGGIVHRNALLTLSGGFHGMVRVIDHLEREVATCHLASVGFRSVRRNGKPPQLIAQLILGQIIIKSDK